MGTLDELGVRAGSALGILEEALVSVVGGYAPLYA
jgi:hypothetical protein